MNSRTSLALLVVLTAVGTLFMSSAYAQTIEEREHPSACVGCDPQSPTAKMMLLNELTISVWTDKNDYTHEDVIMVSGHVANTASSSPITLTYVNPLNTIVSIDQISIADDGTFETSISTAGTMWKYDGLYTITAQYGELERRNSVQVELTGGETTSLHPVQDAEVCGSGAIEVIDQCVPYTITGGTVTGVSVNTEDKSLVFSIDTTADGVLTLTPPKSVIDGTFLVLVDDEESDDSVITETQITAPFFAGAEKVEVIGTFVIPEFGMIAVMILAVALVSIVVVSARSSLGIVPRY